MKIALAALVGFLVGLLIFAIGREVWLAFETRPAGEVVSHALSAIGSLKWIDTTLITGLAAVGAAYLSVSAVRDQIKQTAAIEADRRDAKLAAARAVLPLTLSELCGYAQDSAEALLLLRSRCVGAVLPRTAEIPSFPRVPDDTISDLKEVIEFLDANERFPFTMLIIDIQVQAARMFGIQADQRGGMQVMRYNIEVFVGDAAKIYARANSLFEYARGQQRYVPTTISRREVGTTIHLLGVYDEELRNRLGDSVHRQINERPDRGSAH